MFAIDFQIGLLTEKKEKNERKFEILMADVQYSLNIQKKCIVFRNKRYGTDGYMVETANIRTQNYTINQI